MQASSYDKIIWDHTWTFTVPDRSSAECIAYASIAIFCKQSNTHVQLYSCTCTASDCMSCSFNCKHSFCLSSNKNTRNIRIQVHILVSENDLFLTLGLGTSNARNENLRLLLNTNIPLISGNYGLRNHFWPLESRFLMRKNEKKSIFSKLPQCPILSFWILNLHIIICQFKKKIHSDTFFCLTACSCH